MLRLTMQVPLALPTANHSQLFAVIFFVGFAKVTIGDMSIDLGCADVAMAQHSLNAT